ncbi:response regulator transcription factor [Pleurocapsa sp. CCALA 161]|uniref:response regulator n=1 Tax=Pleurocapsa sp. CCALA 161 TaxID=2107688 RepID=UPI0013049EA2|nr:response regulator [Pleurocapsa sp. CCALA 161]
MTIRILLADDQFLILEGIKAILEPEPEIEVVGTAQDGQSAIALVKKLRPDILLMDIEMPKMNGILATKYICKYLPDIKIIVLTSHKSQDYIAEALLAGASGYLLKSNLIKDLKQEIYSFGGGYSSVKAKLLTRIAKKNSTANVLQYREKIIYLKKYRKNIYKPAVNQKQRCFYSKGLLTLKGISAGVPKGIHFDISFRTPLDKDTASHIVSRSRQTSNIQLANLDITKASLAPISKPFTTKRIRATNPKTSSPSRFNRRKYLRKIIWLLLAISSIVLSIVIF